jgi:hypothetical protein
LSESTVTGILYFLFLLSDAANCQNFINMIKRKILKGTYLIINILDTREGLLYVHTDVGGAYRWDPADSTWIPVTDHIGKNESDYMGILSIATDPTDPNRVYLAAGLLNITLSISWVTIMKLKDIRSLKYEDDQSGLYKTLISSIY